MMCSLNFVSVAVNVNLGWLQLFFAVPEQGSPNKLKNLGFRV